MSRIIEKLLIKEIRRLRRQRRQQQKNNGMQQATIRKLWATIHRYETDPPDIWEIEKQELIAQIDKDKKEKDRMGRKIMEQGGEIASLKDKIEDIDPAVLTVIRAAREVSGQWVDPMNQESLSIPKAMIRRLDDALFPFAYIRTN